MRDAGGVERERRERSEKPIQGTAATVGNSVFGGSVVAFRLHDCADDDIGWGFLREPDGCVADLILEHKNHDVRVEQAAHHQSDVRSGGGSAGAGLGQPQEGFEFEIVVEFRFFRRAFLELRRSLEFATALVLGPEAMKSTICSQALMGDDFMAAKRAAAF